MDKKTLQSILSKPFVLADWQNLLTEVLGVKNFWQKPEKIEFKNEEFFKKAESAYELGSFNTADDRIIGLYLVKVKPEVWLERNKVGLRELLRSVYDYDVDGAIIVFEQADKWRLSFVSEIRTFDEEGNITKKITEPKRYTYLLGKGEKIKTPVDRLFSIAGKKLYLEEIRNAFSVEALNTEFYKIVARHFYQLVGATEGKGAKAITYNRVLNLPIGNPSDNASRKVYQEFAVRLIGRTVFCWFLKVKKSDEGISLVPEHLLSSEAVKKNSNYYNSILEKLFFQTLNTPMPERRKDLPDGCEQIPFLNGGLFEPQTEDYYKPNKTTGFSDHINTLKIPDEWFNEFFENLEQYNFTIDENSVVDIEVSVDPEMLGRIFENLLAEIDPDSGETARKATGSFYTPREIVDYMATESLVLYLHNQTQIDKELLKPIFKIDSEVSFSKPDSEKILEALDRLKILDPACGSGAFPMGVLQKIVMALQKLDRNAEWWKARQINRIENALLRKQVKEKLELTTVEYARKIGVIQNTLYGVDIQPIAAEISKLRCFLTLVVDENIDESKPNRGVEPLPNLEFKFVTADALLKLPDEKDFGGLFNSFDDLEQLKQIRLDYLQSYGEHKNELKAEFKRIQNKISKQQIKSGVADVNSRAFLISSWNPFSNEKVDWFDPSWMYGVDNFDIVIGNPPYVEHKKLKHIASKLKPMYNVYTGSSDLSVYFFERAFALLCDNGSLNFISTNKFFNTGYGKALRSYLIDKSIASITNFEQVEVFKGILVSSVIYLSENKKASSDSTFEYHEFKNETGWKTNFEEKLKLRKRKYYQNVLSEAEWVFLQGNESEIKEKIEKAGVPLKDISGVEIKRGVTTGFDPAFIIDKETKDYLDADIIEPLILGRDIKKYKLDSKERFLINSHNGQKGYANRINLISEYPKVYEYLKKIDDENEQKVSKRTDIGDHWTNLRACAFLNLFELNKIVWPLTADQWGFALDTERHFLTSGAFFLVSEKYSLKTLLAILNSKVLEYYFRFIGVMTAGGAFTLKKATIELLPIAVNKYTKTFEALVDYILLAYSTKKSINEHVPNSHLIQLFEEVIDALVYELYFDEDFKKAGIDFMKYAQRDFKSIEGKDEKEAIAIIEKAYQTLREKDNEIRNNLKLMDIKLADLIMPIKTAK
ncbi:MAG: Eco57I restriction-modification methylase domain-containing protein [Flavobacteriales bacterium]|nr:Eco57I restriction-modification methylase domain-containing protein [Flavobacteriales bacterium]